MPILGGRGTFRDPYCITGNLTSSELFRAAGLPPPFMPPPMTDYSYKQRLAAAMNRIAAEVNVRERMARESQEQFNRQIAASVNHLLWKFQEDAKRAKKFNF